MKKLFLLALLSATLFACKKDKEPAPPPASINGYWIGTWSRLGNSSQFEMAVVLRENGTARILYGYVGGDTAAAIHITEDHFTYNASEGTAEFKSRESSYTYSYFGTASGNTMSGTWGEMPSVDDGGTWTMTKQ